MFIADSFTHNLFNVWQTSFLNTVIICHCQHQRGDCVKLLFFGKTCAAVKQPFELEGVSVLLLRSGRLSRKQEMVVFCPQIQPDNLEVRVHSTAQLETGRISTTNTMLQSGNMQSANADQQSENSKYFVHNKKCDNFRVVKCHLSN